uniref:Alpha-galactosidase NEW3 domain-containing protein n=1 Tax=Ignisphaera aggregans TaxID=334771 RepID=A0A7C5YW91_9CREN
MKKGDIYRKVLAMTIALMLTILYIPLHIFTVYSLGDQFEVISVVWGTPTSPICVGPGMQTQMLTVTLRYNGNDSFLGLKAELYLPWPLRDSLSKTSIAESKYTQLVAKSQLITLTFWIDIGENAAVGDYTAYLVLYGYSNGEWIKVEEKSINIVLIYTEKLSIKPSIISVYPGYTNISIRLENIGNGYAYGVSLEASSQSPQISIVKPSIWIGEISPYSTIDINIPLYISPTLIGSTNSLYLRINYVDECGFNRVFTSTIYLLVEQPKPPQIMLRISPTTIIAGIKNNVTVTIINNGSTAVKGVVVSFDFPQQIILVNGTPTWFIDELKPYSTSNISFILTSLGVSSDKTVSQIFATVSYRDQYGIDRSDKITITLTIIKPQTLIDIDIEPRNLTPGRVNELILSVRNIGNVSIYGLDLSITLPQPLIFKDFDGKWYIGDLKPGEEKTRKLYVIVPSTTSGPIQMTMMLSYIDIAFTPRTEARYIGFTVIKPQESLIIQLFPHELGYGENSIEIIVFNNNPEKVYGTIATISSSQLIFKDFDGKWYIGDLEPGESKALKLKVFVPSTTATTIQISISLQYRDIVGTVMSESRILGVSLKPTTTLLTTLIEPEQVSVGENNVTIHVGNYGNTSVYSLQATITVQGATFKRFDGKWYIGDLKPKDTKNLTLLLIVPSTTSVVQITITYSYIDVGGGSRSETRVVWLEVKQLLTDIAVEVEPQTLSMGENSITIYIKNKGESSIYNTVVAFSIPQQIVLLESDGKIYIGEIKPNETKALPLKIAIISGTTTIQIPITISYTDIAGLSRNENRVLSFRIAAQSTTPNFKISIEPNSIISGRQSKLKLAIANIANRRLDNITVAISSTTIAFIGFDGKWFIDSLNPSEVRSIELAVYINPVQVTQSITTAITLTYIDTFTGNSISETTSLAIIAMPNTLKEPLEITVYPQILVAGRINNLTVSIRNPNNFNVSSTTLSITSPTGTILLASDTYFISLLKPNDRKDIELSLYIPSTSGTTLSLPISISYFDGIATNTFSKSIAFLVALPPMLKITNYAILPQTISPGQTFSISLTIANIGLGSAYNVTAMALPSQFYTPLLGSETFIGEISKGASTTITFSFRASSQLNITAPRPGNITRPFNTTGTFPTIARSITYPQYGDLQPRVIILIMYTDNVGKSYNTTLLIPLIIASSNTATITTHISEGISNINIALMLAVIVAIVTVIYVIIRLRKR